MATYLSGVFARESAVRWSLRGTTISGGRSLTGRPQVVRNDGGGGYWEAELSSISIRTADHLRQWRAYEALLDGGATEVIVSSCEIRTAPWPTVDGERVFNEGIPHDDDTLFDDGTGYYETVIKVEVATAADLGATSMELTLTEGGRLQAGMAFSIEHPTESHRRYHIITAEGAEASPTVTFRPPLREAVTVGTELDFDFPKCLMRLASEDGMDVAFELRRYARPSVRFVEA